MEARFWTIGEVRQSVLELVRKYYDYETASACGRLIDELVAWSRAKGLVEKKHFGKSPVMKFAPAEGMNEAWAIYCEHRQGAGPKLSLVPGRRDHGLELREIVERLCGPPEGGWDGKKLDMTLARIALRSDWSPIFEGLQRAVDHVLRTHRGR